MHKLGLIGGLSWTSTARYYEIINQAVHRARGGQHSAPLLIESLDFATVAACTSDEEWDSAADVLIAAARRLETAGAGALLICANSMHRVYDRVQGAVHVPILHIAERVGKKMQADGVEKAALIGTRNVMTEKFYRQRLVAHGVSLLPPDMELADRIDRIVYDELTVGKISRESERYMKSEMTDIAKQDVQAVVLACTELELIVDVKANVLPIYDCTSIHAMAGVEFILG
ncbi:MAG: amino acid racemase [Sphingobium sp.]|jgi:aspartate racemase|uniref:Aspartate racemase n=1 Tax=Sphingobium xenophagum TaxID=121428 RepID=A0A401IZR1_SPHXE|nr:MULTISPECIES: amino acid racemase [Sphingobium]MBU0658872.1 amino acid racemase [Alphaproteobacteria bacterium]MBA4753689.1 amino acid racemase [Sphingobium sp.]MBG6119649.1 aspartate racemase [Sphingobium sp. JAI105]MBS86876.1 aspartate racemase [Sphingobium sp.]MBU0775393.1 amino acid racemase [Alphaproteobacteria bacterium]|tara:strand:+ start:2111 stop:2800 length:690 start_codon:yes stop_codon:yes gene_type:complete